MTQILESLINSYEGAEALNGVDPSKFKFYKSSIYAGQVSARFAAFWKSPASNFFFEDYLASQAADSQGLLKVRPVTEGVYATIRGLAVHMLSGNRYMGASDGRAARDLFTVSCPAILYDSSIDRLPDELEMWAIPHFETNFAHEPSHLFQNVKDRGESVSSALKDVADISASDMSAGRLLISAIASAQNHTSELPEKHSPSRVRKAVFENSLTRDSLAEYFCRRICTPQPETYVYGAVYRKDLTAASLSTDRPHLVIDILTLSPKGIPTQPAPFPESAAPTGFGYAAGQFGLRGSSRGNSIKERGYLRLKIYVGMFSSDFSEAVWYAQGGCAKIAAVSLADTGLIFNKDGFHLDLGQSKLFPLCPDHSVLRSWASGSIFPNEDSYGRQILSYTDVCARSAVSRISAFQFLQATRVIDQATLGIEPTRSGVAWSRSSNTQDAASGLMPEVQALMATFGSSWFQYIRLGTTAKERGAVLQAVKVNISTLLSYSSNFSCINELIVEARKKIQFESIPVPDIVPEDLREDLKKRFVSDPVFKTNYLKTNDHNRYLLLVRQGFIPLQAQAA